MKMTDTLPFNLCSSSLETKTANQAKPSEYDVQSSSEVKFGGEKPIEDTGSKTNEEPEEQVDQVFLEELERLKRQENDANDAAEALRKEFA
ncbi:hypothetical protein Tco_0370949 [Tanacetum coccineum]